MTMRHPDAVATLQLFGRDALLERLPPGARNALALAAIEIADVLLNMHLTRRQDREDELMQQLDAAEEKLAREVAGLVAAAFRPEVPANG